MGQQLPGVWHLKETPGGSNAIRDSTKNGNHATDVNTPTPGANWQIDGAENYASASQEYDRGEGESPFDIPRSITVSAWIKVTSFTQNWQAIVTKGDSAYGIQRGCANQSSTGTGNCLCWHLNTCGGTEFFYGNRKVNDANFHYAVAVFNGTSSTLYTDGTRGQYDADLPLHNPEYGHL